MVRQSPHSLLLLQPPRDSTNSDAVDPVLRYGQNFCLGIPAGLECKTVSLLVHAYSHLSFLFTANSYLQKGLSRRWTPFLLSLWIQSVGSSGHFVPCSFLLTASNKTNKEHPCP